MAVSKIRTPPAYESRMIAVEPGSQHRPLFQHGDLDAGLAQGTSGNLHRPGGLLLGLGGAPRGHGRSSGNRAGLEECAAIGAARLVLGHRLRLLAGSNQHHQALRQVVKVCRKPGWLAGDRPTISCALRGIMVCNPTQVPARSKKKHRVIMYGLKMLHESRPGRGARCERAVRGPGSRDCRSGRSGCRCLILIRPPAAPWPSRRWS